MFGRPKHKHVLFFSDDERRDVETGHTLRFIQIVLVLQARLQHLCLFKKQSLHLRERELTAAVGKESLNLFERHLPQQLSGVLV